MPLAHEQGLQCLGCGRPADDCCCDDEYDDRAFDDDGDDDDEPWDPDADGWPAGGLDPGVCRRCGRLPCSCRAHCELCGHGLGHDYRRRPEHMLHCGRCNEAFHRDFGPWPAFTWRRVGLVGTARQRRAAWRRRWQRRCSDCGRRRSDPRCECVPF